MDMENIGLVFPRGAGSSTRWTTLWETDFRTLANQTILPMDSSGAITNVTLGGAPWILHQGGGQGSGQPTLEIKNGVGLVCNYSGMKSSGNGYAGFHASVKVTQLAGYDPAKSTCVQVRFYRGPLLNYPGYTFDSTLSGIAAIGASYWTGTEAWGMPTGLNDTIAFDPTSPPTITVRGPYYGEIGRITLNTRTAPAVQDTASEFVFASMVTPWEDVIAKDRNVRSYWYQRDAFLATLPEVEDMQCANVQQMSYSGAPYAQHKMGAYFGSTGVNRNALTQVRVLQRPLRAI